MFGVAPTTKKSTMTAAVAVIGKKNEPLFFRCYDDAASTDLYFQSLVFSSLDAIDDCVARKANQRDMYLGFLCPVDEFQVYGYMTNMKMKVFVVLDDQNRVQEADLRAFFQRLHGAPNTTAPDARVKKADLGAYVEHLRNPFAPVDPAQITSKRFADTVDQNVAAFLDKAQS